MKNISLALRSSAVGRFLNMLFVASLVAMSAVAVGCSEEKEESDKTYVEGVSVTSNKSEVCSGKEQVLTVTFETDNGYTLETDEPSVVSFLEGASGSAAGKHQVRIQLQKNSTESDRVAIIYITVTGHKLTQLMSITQKSGANDAVVQWIDERLQKEYYWMDEYNEKHDTFDYTLSYDKFLSQSLLSLTTNELDGGRDAKGDRYLYSYIEKVGGSGSSSGTRASSVKGYGLFLCPYIWTLEDGVYGFAVEHVYPGSSAEGAGIRRGDIISKVNGGDITQSNLNSLWYGMQYGDIGTISVTKLDPATLDPANVTLSIGSYEENPVAFRDVIALPESLGAVDKKIGYLSYLSFDSAFDSELIAALQELKDNGITDLILDLRVNGGGAVRSSVKLASSILGSKYEGQIYSELKRHPKNRHGNSTWKIITQDGTTPLPSLDMPALWVLATDLTASASEMVIVGLRGLDVPVTIVGGKTEGKNCGMDVEEMTINSVTYSYAPITFLNYNAKGFNDYADGIEPDIDIRSYADKSDNKEVQYFANVFPMPFCDWGVTNRDLALYETVLQICGKSVLDSDYGKDDEDEGGENGDGENGESGESGENSEGESNDGGESAALKLPKLQMASSMTRAGEPLRLQHKRKVFGATISAEERERLSVE